MDRSTKSDQSVRSGNMAPEISQVSELPEVCVAFKPSRVASLRETDENRSKDSQEQHVGSREWPQARLQAHAQTCDHN